MQSTQSLDNSERRQATRSPGGGRTGKINSWQPFSRTAIGKKGTERHVTSLFALFFVLTSFIFASPSFSSFHYVFHILPTGPKRHKGERERINLWGRLPPFLLPYGRQVFWLMATWRFFTATFLMQTSLSIFGEHEGRWRRNSSRSMHVSSFRLLHSDGYEVDKCHARFFFNW